MAETIILVEKLSKRQLNILNFIRKKGEASNQEIKQHIGEIFNEVSRVTVVRDINQLLKGKFIVKEGRGRGILYKDLIKSKLLAYFDVDEYFKTPPDKRAVAFEHFNFEISENLKDFFSKDELLELEKLNFDYRERIKKLPPTILKKEFERLTIELSWKSSRIEGNTYSLIDTEVLIKEHKEASGHKKEEAIMILNHKKALDYILDKKSDFKTITLGKIENLQRVITEELNVSTGLRKSPVGITGTRYKPLDNDHQIKEAMEKTIEAINLFKDPFSKALASLLMISYIQPFEDGNKRTSRILGDAILLAYNVCPLSFRSMDEADYKKAIILFYEQNSARFFKELFIEQFNFAVSNYFLL